jgi:hypothetical protein
VHRQGVVQPTVPRVDTQVVTIFDTTYVTVCTASNLLLAPPIPIILGLDLPDCRQCRMQVLLQAGSQHIRIRLGDIATFNTLPLANGGDYLELYHPRLFSSSSVRRHRKQRQRIKFGSSMGQRLPVPNAAQRTTVPESRL